MLIVPMAAQAETMHYTRIVLTNGTTYYVYVDTYEHHGLIRHWGMVAPNAHVALDIKMPDLQYFTDVYVYVKQGRMQHPEDTICTVKKTFGNTGYSNVVDGRVDYHGTTLHEHVHYNGKTCSIDPV